MNTLFYKLAEEQNKSPVCGNSENLDVLQGMWTGVTSVEDFVQFDLIHLKEREKNKQVGVVLWKHISMIYLKKKNSRTEESLDS